MKAVFFGTPEYVLPILKAVHKKFVTGPGKSPFVAVVTQPPKPVGRKQLLAYSPIDKWAHEHKIDCFYNAEDLLDSELDIEIGILAAYGEIIPKEVINLFPQGILVIHPSLLPQFRWGAPIPATILTNTNPTGVSIIRMDPKFDNGPIITQFKEDMFEDDTTESLRARLFIRSAEVLVETLTPYIRGKIKPKTQTEENASYAKARLLTKNNSLIPLEHLKKAINNEVDNVTWEIPFLEDQNHETVKLEWNAVNIERFIRAMYPWPGAWTLLENGKRLKLIKAHLESEKLILDEVQVEGKEIVTFKQFLQAYSL